MLYVVLLSKTHNPTFAVFSQKLYTSLSGLGAIESGANLLTEDFVVGDASNLCDGVFVM